MQTSFEEQKRTVSQKQFFHTKKICMANKISNEVIKTYLVSPLSLKFLPALFPLQRYCLELLKEKSNYST